LVGHGTSSLHGSKLLNRGTGKKLDSANSMGENYTKTAKRAIKALDGQKYIFKNIYVNLVQPVIFDMRYT